MNLLLEPAQHRTVDDELVDGVGYPKCFDSREQYDAWAIEADRTEHLAPTLPLPGETPEETAAEPVELLVREHGICADCTLRYQQQMIKEGRCARPEKKLLLR